MTIVRIASAVGYTGEWLMVNVLLVAPLMFPPFTKFVPTPFRHLPLEKVRRIAVSLAVR